MCKNKVLSYISIFTAGFCLFGVINIVYADTITLNITAVNNFRDFNGSFVQDDNDQPIKNITPMLVIMGPGEVVERIVTFGSSIEYGQSKTQQFLNITPHMNFQLVANGQYFKCNPGSLFNNDIDSITICYGKKNENDDIVHCEWKQGTNGTCQN